MKQGDAQSLPQGWEIKRLGEVCNFQNGFAFKSKTFKKKGIPIVRITNIQNEKLNLSKIVYIDPKDYDKNLSKYEIVRGDLLIAMSGATTGKIGIHQTDEKLLLNQRVGKFSPKPALNKSFLFNFLATKVEESLSISAGAAQPNLSTEQIKNFEIPIPPLAEQKRIVAKLDQAFAAIARAKANAEQNLTNAQELFESYLQGVFENKGEEWKKTTIGKMVESGLLAKPLDGNHGEIHPKKRDYVSEGIPFIMASDLQNGKVNTKDCKFITKEQGDSLRKGFSNDGDILLSHKATIGRTAILETSRAYVMLTPQVTYYRILEKGSLWNRYVYYYFQSSGFQKDMMDYAGVGSTRAYIGITKQLRLKFAYPKQIKEQKQIVKKLDALSAETQKLAAIYQQKIADLEELKKSILQKAFEGQLTMDN